MNGDYKIATSYVRMMIQADDSFLGGFDKGLISELSSSLENDFIDGELVNRLFESIAAQGLLSWVSEYGIQIGVGSHGPMGFAALSAPNLLTALQIAEEYLETRSSGTKATLQQNDKNLNLILEDQTGNELAGRWLIESSFLVVQNLVETIMAHPLGPQAQLHFAYERQAWHQQVEKIFNARCLYSQADNRICIPASWGAVASPLHDAETFRTNLAKAREIKLQLNTDQSNVQRLVSTRLINHFERRLSNTAKRSTIPTLEVLAGELAMSPRTLIRKLADQGTAYKTLLEGIRLQQAELLLKNTHLTAAEIADKLGYQEPANFGRAFKRWTGDSPAAWRRHQT